MRPPLGCDRIERAHSIGFRRMVVARMQSNRVPRGVTAFVSEQDEIDYDAALRKWLYRGVERGNLLCLKKVVASGDIPMRAIRLLIELVQRCQIAIQGSMFDFQSERVVRHLDLQTFLARGNWKGITILGVGGDDGHSAREHGSQRIGWE